MIENNVNLIGNLTSDIKGKYAGDQQNPVFVASGTIAVKYRYNKQTQQEEMSFINFNLMGSRFEKIAKYFTKGSKIAIQGRLETGSYENKQGQTVYYTRVEVDDATLLKYKDPAQQPPQQRQAPAGLQF